MPGTDDLQQFIEERLLLFDPDVDLSDGSPAQVTVVDPIVRRYASDPFEIDVETFIRTRLRQELPDLSSEEGDTLADLLVKPMRVLLDPIVREVTFLRNNKSLASPELLAPAEADSLMGNLFVARTRGALSVGVVRLYFNAPIAISVSVGNTLYTADGLNFIPSQPQAISAEAMIFNQSGNLFYFDVSVEAEREGDEYNVEVAEVVGVTNVPSSVRVSNLSRFRDGLPEESTVAFVERGETEVTERSLVVPRGTIARLFNQFGDLQHLQVVGFNDPEMLRDIITGGGLGSVVKFGADGATSDDGNGDGFSDVFESATGDFTNTIRSPGGASSFTLSVDGVDYFITEVINGTSIRITAADGGLSELPDNLASTQYYIRQNVLTLSGIPGGIIQPNGPNGEVIIERDRVHIGGSSDFYVRGISLDDKEQVIEAVSDESPIVDADDIETLPASLPADIVKSTATDFAVAGVQCGMTLVIETGGDAGSYQILKVNPRGTDPKELQVDPEPTAAQSGLSYKIVDEIDINLNEPRTMRVVGTAMKTVQGSAQVSTVSAIDFDVFGVQAGDILRILGGGLNAGDFQIEQVTGIGNKLLILTTEMKQTSSSEGYEIFHLQGGIETPLVRIKTIDILDSSLQATGDTVPYADPVDIQSFSFSNIGVGEKALIEDAQLGILGSVNLTTPSAVNAKTLRVKINDGTTIVVTFAGVTTTQHIIDQINTAVGSVYIAEILDVDGEYRLSLRSRNNWIKVEAGGTANTDLGLSTTAEEDNRQVKSSSITSQLGIAAERDSVYVQTGDNIEFWFVHEVSVGKMLMSRVDAQGRVVFPLTDPRATVRVGSRSFGKVRCYFLEPTSVEVRGSYRASALASGSHIPNQVYGVIAQDELPRAVFTLDVYGDETTYKRFFPDPSLSHQILPAATEDVPDNMLVGTVGDTFVLSEKDPTIGPGQYSRSAKMDFLLREVRPGDILEMTYQPVQGSVDIRDVGDGGAVNYAGGDLDGLTLILSAENGPNKTVQFDLSIDTPSKVAGRINDQLGTELAFIEEATSGEKYLRLEADIPFTLRSSGTANIVLGLAADNNEANARGEFIIQDAGYISGAISDHFRLAIDRPVGTIGAWGGFTAGQVGPSQHFVIKRPGVQRISSTEMEANQDGGLFYAEIELVSFGPGDEFNIGPDLQLNVEGHVSDGWRLVAVDQNLTFSAEEQVRMCVGRRLITPGTTDSPSNATQLSQQNIQINYSRSPLVTDIQSFVQSDLDRVLNASLLVRHLIPHFILAEVRYEGGSQTSVVKQDIEDYISGLLPEELLEASALSEIPRRRGAERVELPIVIVGVVHEIDRRIRVQRSEDAISRGRLSTFIPDVLTVEREQT